MSSKRKKTDDPDENVFQVLKRYDVSLRSNIEVILNKLGFDSLNSLSKLSKVPDYFKEMEESVATVLGDKEYCGNMSIEDKRALFGEFFAKKPEKFRFVLGDKCAIRSAVETANTLIVSAQKDYCYDDPYKKKKRRYNRKQTQGDYPVVDNAIKNDNDSDIHVVTLDAEESNLLNILLPRVTGVMESNQNITRVSNDASALTSERQQVANQPQPLVRKGKTLSQYLSSWLVSTKLKDHISQSDWIVNKEGDGVQCTRCKSAKIFKVTADPTGGWKTSTFARHLQEHVKHACVGRTVEKNATPNGNVPVAESSIGKTVVANTRVNSVETHSLTEEPLVESQTHSESETETTKHIETRVEFLTQPNTVPDELETPTHIEPRVEIHTQQTSGPQLETETPKQTQKRKADRKTRKHPVSEKSSPETEPEKVTLNQTLPNVVHSKRTRQPRKPDFRK